MCQSTCLSLHQWESLSIITISPFYAIMGLFRKWLWPNFLSSFYKDLLLNVISSPCCLSHSNSYISQFLSRQHLTLFSLNISGKFKDIRQDISLVYIQVYCHRDWYTLEQLYIFLIFVLTTKNFVVVLVSMVTCYTIYLPYCLFQPQTTHWW